MGLANLALAQHALASELAEDPDLHARTVIARGRATSALRRHTLWVIGLPEPTGRTFGSGWPFYRLYALEKVCVFLGREDVGGLDWYRIGVERLLESQLPDGGWAQGGGRADAVATSFALLFLLRDAESYRPITPRPIGAPTGPVTPRPASETTTVAPPRSALPLSVANAGLARLAKELERKRIDALTPALEALTFVRRTYGTYRPEGAPLSPEHDEWCRRAEDVLLEASVLFDSSAKADRDQRMAIALECLNALAHTSGRIGPRLMERVLDRKNDKTFPAPFRVAWYGAAVDALRAVEPLQLSPWLARRCLTDDPDRIWRSMAALVALSGLAPTLSGRERRATALGVVEQLKGIARRSDGNYVIAHVQRDAAICLARLAGLPAESSFPWPLGRTPDAEYRAIAAWIQAHDGPDDPAWR